MAKIFISLVLALVVVSAAATRPFPTTTTASSESDPHAPLSTTSITPSPEPGINGDECESMESRECLRRMTMVAHTDYIYTQDINGP